MRRRRAAVAAGTALALGAGFAYGFVSHRDRLFPYGPLAALYRRLKPEPAPQLWWRHRSGAAAPGVEASRVLALPYLAGYEPAPAARGVTRHERTAASPGLSFYYSGHAPRAFLIDMDGRPLHEWGARFEEVWPGREVPRGSRGSEGHWTFARLLDDGGVLAVFHNLGLVRLDRDSRVVWARAGGYHHDVALAADGSLHALARRKREVPSLNPRAPVYEDLVEVLDRDGRPRREVSLVECLERSRYAPLLRFVDRDSDDPFHTNALRLLDGSWEARAGAFRRGRALVSMPRLNTLAVVDLEERRVAWALTGLFASQHQPTPLASGRLLVFDNWGRAGRSRVVELDPLTQAVAWEFPADPASDFYSACCGAAQRLPNGNTLVTESTNGRALEVTPDGRTVWEFVNPARAGRDRELVATLFRLVRLDPASPLAWLPARPTPDGRPLRGGASTPARRDKSQDRR